jgi:hypothetical protein
LFQANEDRELTLENVEANTPGGEGATVKFYTFRLGDVEAVLRFERFGIAGNA